MNDDRCQVIRHPAARAFEDRALRTQVTNVAFAQNGRNAVSGASLATLAAALAACGGGGSGGPAAPAQAENRPPTVSNPSPTTATEDGDPVTGDAVGSDPDGDALTYEVTQQGTYGTLAHDADGWTYTITDSPEIQALGVGSEPLTDTITIKVSDEDGAEATMEAKVEITIEGANDAPTVEARAATVDDAKADGVDPDLSIAEDSDGSVPGGVVAHIALDDVDSADTPDTLTVTPGDDRFEVIEAYGEKWLKLKAGQSLDFEAEPAITVTLTVTDSNGGTGTTDVTITVTNVNEAPDAPTLEEAEGGRMVEENDASGRNIGTLSSSDPEGGEVTFSVDDDHFEIEAVGGTTLLKYKGGAGIDFEGEKVVDGTLTIMLTATDAEGNVSEATPVTITVTNVNEAPTIMFDGDAETPDGAPAKSTVTEHNVGDGEFEPVPVGQVTVSDPDGEMLTAEHIKVDDARFGLMTDSLGGIWLMLNEGLDADVTDGGTVTVKLMVKDGDGLTGEVEAVITVEDVNESPTIMLREGMAPAADGGASASGAIDENATGAVYEIDASDPEDEISADHITIDDKRFEVRTDSEGGLWVFLKEPVSYEGADGESGTADDISSIPITATVTDSGGVAAMDSATVTIRDVNDAPTASGELPTVTGTAGEALAGDQTRIDLDMFFSDSDEGDELTYETTGGPGWLDFKVDDETGHGVLSGTPLAGTKGSYEVTITASDGDLSASGSFTLVIDDGNNPITGISFADKDGKDNPLFEISVEENKPGEASEEGKPGGTLLGTFSAEDEDSPDHPNGMITWSLPRGEQRFEIDANTGELRLREGVSLDFEAPGLDSNNEIKLKVTAKDGGDPALSAEETLFIAVKDADDAPEVEVDAGINVGWWVVRNSDFQSGTDQREDSYAAAGSWLTFSLETAGDQRPAFSDSDLGTGDRLSYSLVADSPSWLEILPTGVIRNKAGMVADAGVYDVTVRATDSSPGSDDPADFTFRLAVAVSNFNDSGDPTDNEAPAIRREAVDIKEDAPAGAVVARFTVQDDDLPLGPVHPWGRLDVHVTSDVASRMDHVAQVGETPETTFRMEDLFSVHHTGTADDTASYEVRLTAAGARWLDHEDNDEVELTIRARDFSDATLLSESVDPTNGFDAFSATNRDRGVDVEEVTFDIDDVNEAPAYQLGQIGTNTSSTLNGNNTTRPLTFAVDQREIDPDQIQYIYLNLTEMFQDPEDMDNYGDGGFMVDVSAGAPWLTLLPVNNSVLGGMRTGPQRWEDIETSTDDNVDIGAGTLLEWGTDSPGTDATNAPAANDIVVILRVDRDSNADGGSIRQDENGMIAITATDDDGASDTTNIRVRVDDQNVPVDDADVGKVVTVTGPARQGSTLDMTFNERFDPDFTGDAANPSNPILVRYQWVYDPNTPDDSVDDDVRQQTTSDEDYTLMPRDVGGTVQGRVIYYELFDGEIVQSSPTSFISPASGNVANRPDEGSATFTVSTNDSDQLVLTIPAMGPGSFMDGDRPVDGSLDVQPFGPTTVFSYSWESSPNGQSLWTPFATGASTTGSAPVPPPLAVPDAQEGQYVRLVITYQDEGGRNRIESQAVKVGNIDHVDVGSGATQLHIDTSAGTPPPTGTVSAGWTLQIGGLADVVPGGSSEVEWLIGSRVVGEGREYTVSTGDRDSTTGNSIFMARVTRYDAEGNLVSKATVPLPSGVTLTRNEAPDLAQAEPHYVDLGKAPDANGKYAKLAGKIDLQALFTDPEGGPVGGFNIPTTAPAGGFVDSVNLSLGRGDNIRLWADLGSNSGGDPSADNSAGPPDPEGDQILLINERTGDVEYHSTQDQDHGRTSSADNDGDGNWISVTVTGSDSARATSPSATVNLRIDAAPTGFQVSADVPIADGSADDNAAMTIPDPGTTPPVTERPLGSTQPFEYGSGTGSGFDYYPYTVREHDGDEVVTAGDQALAAGGVLTEAAGYTGTTRVIARIDVQDDNEASHAYGQYTFTVDDDRFEVVPVPASLTDGDASQGILRLKTGQNLDREALPPMGRIDLVVTATPVDPDGSDPHDAITLGIRITVVDVPEATDPDPDRNDVPGLKDNESNGNATGNDAGANPDPTSDAARNEVVGDDTDTTDDTDANDDTGDADGDYDGGWWSASEDGLF